MADHEHADGHSCPECGTPRQAAPDARVQTGVVAAFGVVLLFLPGGKGLIVGSVLLTCAATMAAILFWNRGVNTVAPTAGNDEGSEP